LADDIYPAGSPLSIGTAPHAFLKIAGERAIETLDRLRREHQDKCPVIWGDAEEASRLFELYEDDPADITPPPEILARAASREAETLLREHVAEVTAALARLTAGTGMPAVREREDADTRTGAIPQELRGPWPENIQPHASPLILTDFATGDFKQEILIGLMPTARAWEAPAYADFGGWNACPPAHIHVALAKQWNDCFGARLIVMGADVIEFELEQPIQDRATALDLAEQHFRYCEDVVTQGTGTIEALAAHLIGARYWYFWWD